jgi:hypothetical protein
MPLGSFHYDAASLVSAVVNPNHVLPRTNEWNVLTVAYLGSTARKLVRQDIYDGPNTDLPGEMDLMSNDDSSYQALEAQFRQVQKCDHCAHQENR